jgi:hypothetical protein
VTQRAASRIGRTALAALFVASLCAPTNVRAASASVVASKDNSIFANNVDNSNGGGAGIFVGTTNMMQSDSLRRGLIEFDVASVVPTGATITAVNLTMYLGQASQPSGIQAIDLHRLTADWGEGTAGNFTSSISGTGTGSPASAGDATWNQRFYQQTNWNAPGAVGDFVDTISGSTDVAATVDTPYVWLSTPTMVSDVQGWLDHPETNDGWILINHAEGVQQTVKAFYSRDASEKKSVEEPLPPSWHPTLDITYTPAALPPNGDYNHNGVVDAADYVLWRDTLGQSVTPAGTGADGNQNGTIDAGDYGYWRARFGNATGGLGSGIAVPEPVCAVHALAIAVLAFSRRRR